MDITNVTELGAWFNTDHAYQPDVDTIGYYSLFLDVAYDQIPFVVEFVSYQPYETSKEMRTKAIESGILYISTEGNGGPLGPHYNLLFRAVHDGHHIVTEAPFNFAGEARASAYMLNLIDHSPYVPKERRQEVKRFLFSEMMGQVAYFYTHGRTYLDDQYAVWYDDATIAAFQGYWNAKNAERGL